MSDPKPAFASAVSTLNATAAAVDEVCSRVQKQLPGAPDLAVVFFSADHLAGAQAIADMINRALAPKVLIGCSGESIVAASQEIEEGPAISLWTASLPETELVPVRLEFARTPEGGSIIGWPDELVEGEWPAGANLLVIGEPYSFPADLLLERLNEDHPGIPAFGGMASGAHGPGENRLILGTKVFDAGAAAVLIHGGVRLRTVVSQGCRPIGQPMVVTKAQQNLLIELGGKPAFERLRDLWPQLTGDEQRLVQRGLHVGQVINEYQDRFEHGDFLIRNVVGADPEKGVIALGDFVRTGQTVQFHVRDAQTADDDLRGLLSAASSAGSSPAGALLFTCNGRGTRLFPEAHHDAAALAAQFGNIPIAGFFAQGEIGPVGKKNFLHGFTASAVLFEPAQKAE